MTHRPPDYDMDPTEATDFYEFAPDWAQSDIDDPDDPNDQDADESLFLALLGGKTPLQDDSDHPLPPLPFSNDGSAYLSIITGRPS